MGDPAEQVVEQQVPEGHRGCPTCGRPTPPDARFCAGCGHRFLGEDEEPELDTRGADPLVGRIIADRYRIDQVIGRGGMGVVYRVEHVRIGKLMAMKLLHGELAREKDVIKRFRREAEAASKLDHPNTVQVFDFGRSEGLMYLVMELLGGKDLGTIIEQEGALPFERVARIGAQIAGSVQQAHGHGIVHRDLKPENVRVLADRSEPDFVKVMDFGLAKLRDSAEERANQSITRAGFIVGTPYYMAPEHIRGEGVDARSDVYALGALMYKCVTGVPPFWAPTPVGVLTKHLTEPVVPPSQKSARRDLPPEADEIVCRAMEKDPRARFASMDELRHELARVLRARGEDTGAIHLGSSPGVDLPGRAPKHSGPYEVTDSGRKVPVATRGDVDKYERGLRWQTWSFQALGLAAIMGLLAAGMYAWRTWDRGASHVAAHDAMEREPNDTPAEAGEIAAGLPSSGYLGRRMSIERSDADVFAIRRPSTGDGARHARVVRLEFSGVPNMDTVLEVFRAGHSDPLLVTDGAGMGGPERVPNMILDEGTFFVRVREVWEDGQRPTENVSDAYALRWDYVEPAEGDEREVNDTFALAERIAIGEERHGYVGWSGDVDWLCLSEDAAEATVILEPIPALDLVLRVEERHLGRQSVIDAGELGAGERTELRAAVSGQTCLVVAADPSGPVASDADSRWSLRVVRGVAAAGQEAPAVAAP